MQRMPRSMNAMTIFALSNYNSFCQTFFTEILVQFSLV